MKKLIYGFPFLLFFSLFSCRQVTDYVVIPTYTAFSSMVSYEMGGTEIEERVYFQDGKKSSDWLFVFYVSADNSLDYSTSGWPLFKDLNEAEYGLYSIRKPDGNPKDNTPSVRCVALWDGANHSNSHLFELGADTQSDLLGSGSFEFTGVEFVENANHNLNMADYNTLKKYLEWVKGHYQYTKIVLVVGSHGAGPGGPSNYDRAMIEDDVSSKGKLMSSKEFSMALGRAGFSGSSKLDLLILDVCLSGSLEDAYQFRNNSKYMICSPANTPGNGNNYTKILESLYGNKDIGALNFGKKVCLDFKDEYLRYEGRTISMIDLSKVEGCFNALDNFSESIIDWNDAKAYLQSNCTYKYDGTYCISYDAGQIADKSKVGYPGCGTAADAFMSRLNEAIVYSWRRGAYDGDNYPYGLSLTLTGKYGPIPSWYREMDFGSSSKWTSRIFVWNNQ